MSKHSRSATIVRRPAKRLTSNASNSSWRRIAIELSIQQHLAWTERARAELTRLGIDSTAGLEDAVAEALSNTNERVRLLRELTSRGEQLSVLLLRLSEVAKIAEL